MRKMYNLFKCIIKSGGILYEIYDKQMELVAESNDVTTLQSKIREEYQMWIKRKASGDMIYFDEIDYDKENNNYFAYTSYNEERAMTYSICLLKNTIFAMSTMMLKMMLERLNLRISKSVMM